MELPSTNPAIQLHFAVAIRWMNANRIGIGIKADQEEINGGTTTKAVFNGFSKIQETLKTS